VTPADCDRTDGEDGGDDEFAVAPTFARRRSCRPAGAQPATCGRLGTRGTLSRRRQPPGELRRRTNVGRKAEPSDQFRPPRCGLCVMKLCAPGPSSARGSCQTLSDGVSPNTEGGQTADGRWNPPTNFGPLVGDLLDMRNSAPMPRPQLSGAIGGSLWPPPHEATVALEEIGS
jgi:hypothetical protein